eukprot:m.1178651 g.1178651  ORF g.1178651 m.1178651 type:complete len:428 (+) comp24527_c1_seq1:177-1460(+)
MMEGNRTSPTAMSTKPSSLLSFPSSLVLKQMKECGGGRGVFATEFIRAGSVILTETPFLTVPTDRAPHETSHAALVRLVLQLQGEDAGDASRIFLNEALRVLHPTSLSDLNVEDLEKSRFILKATVAALRKGAPPQVLSFTNDDMILRLLLAMQFNAFDSGLYCKLSMINHGCRPNCSKFTPTLMLDSSENLSKSEIVACRDIHPGEEITISYISPAERSLTSRQSILSEQHFFTLDPTFDAVIDTPKDERLEGLLDELDREFHNLGTDRAANMLHLDRAKDALQLCLESETCVFIKTRAHTHLCNVCFTVTSSSTSSSGDTSVTAHPGNDSDAAVVSKEVLIGTIITLVRSCHALAFELHPLFLPPEHHDVAKVLNDYAQGIAFLLSHDAKALYAAFPHTMGRFALATREEFKAKKRAASIKALYN